MRELYICSRSERNYKDMNVQVKKRNDSIQKIVTIFDKNGEILPIVPGKTLDKEAA